VIFSGYIWGLIAFLRGYVKFMEKGNFEFDVALKLAFEVKNW